MAGGKDSRAAGDAIQVCERRDHLEFRRGRTNAVPKNAIRCMACRRVEPALSAPRAKSGEGLVLRNRVNRVRRRHRTGERGITMTVLVHSQLYSALIAPHKQPLTVLTYF